MGNKLYWGDIHAHCAVSYGSGTAARALDNARRHLDFCSVTGHAFWPDMPMDQLNDDWLVGKHLGGFAKLQYYWKDLLAELRRANRSGKFVTFPSYEWHSMRYGDHNCYFNSDAPDLLDAPDIEALVEALQRQAGAFMVLPHHVGYARGFRGANWNHFDERVTPLVEIYSNHGCGESDDAPYEYHHAMGARVGPSLVRRALLDGHRFGFYAGTDTHDGYPGHYGHGRVGVFAARLDRASIWEALTQRRTIASTGARIAADVTLGDAEIGRTIPLSRSSALRIHVEGTAPIDKVEIVEAAGRQCRVRRLPMPPIELRFSSGRHKIKVETGWGLEAAHDWRVRVRVTDGRFLGADPCFRYSEYRGDEQRSCDRIVDATARQVEWVCRSRPNASGMTGGTHFNAGGTQAVVLDVEATSRTKLDLTCGDTSMTVPMTTLARQSAGTHIAGICSPEIKIHRAVPEREFRFQHREEYRPLAQRAGFVYLRITQTDGQVAWVSPIWFR
jgi:hypothetical protein